MILCQDRSSLSTLGYFQWNSTVQMLTFILHTSVSSFCFWHLEREVNLWNQTWELPKYCHITSWAEITAISQDCFSPGTHPPVTVTRSCFLYCVVFCFFFVCRQIRRKLPLFETCFSLGNTLRGFRPQILNSQINCWKMRRLYCGAFLSAFLVAVTDTDIQWPSGVQRKNVKWFLLRKENVSKLL